MSTCQEGHTHNFPEELLGIACSFEPTKGFLIDIKIRMSTIYIQGVPLQTFILQSALAGRNMQARFGLKKVVLES